MIAPEEEAAVATFLSRHGFSPHSSLLPLAGGGRHAVFKVSDDSRSAVLKHHAKAHVDERESFARELACHQFIAEHAPGSCPSIIGSDSASRSLLFAWVQGAKLGRASIDTMAISRMAQFLNRINAPSSRKAAESCWLPTASEAGLVPQEHLLTARRRIAKLLEVPDHSAVVAEMKSFVAKTLSPAVNRWSASLGAAFSSKSAKPVFSPSDFGFHNVLVTDDGRFVFIDFEHAGWDDAAKLCADFFIQPECILSRELRASFLDEMASGGCFDEGLADRTQALLPLQAAKWTLIILNPFLHTNANAQLLLERLKKARVYFERALADLPNLWKS